MERNPQDEMMPFRKLMMAVIGLALYDGLSKDEDVLTRKSGLRFILSRDCEGYIGCINELAHTSIRAENIRKKLVSTYRGPERRKMPRLIEAINRTFDETRNEGEYKVNEEIKLAC